MRNARFADTAAASCREAVTQLSNVFDFRQRMSGTTAAKVSLCQPEVVPHATIFEWR
jgi:hypothetical protein